MVYTTAELRSLTPIRDNVEKREASTPDLLDVFLRHAWDERDEAAKELIESRDVSVWFSEKDVPSARRCSANLIGV